MSHRVDKLRLVVQEGIRVQRGGAGSIEYIDVSKASADIVARQNHVVFGRRGCGKTLLLDDAKKNVKANIQAVYINCEDYKQHSFPNVLIEILDTLFEALEENLKGWRGWFGRKKRSREVIRSIRSKLGRLKETADELEKKIKSTAATETQKDGSVKTGAKGFELGAHGTTSKKSAIEEEYSQHDSKIHKLNLLLPDLKRQINQFFENSDQIDTIFVELDDFYHLTRTMQPHVADYIHRLCKDLPLYFKVATLRHASTLYADRRSQPTGIQEHHDYLPIDIDFTLAGYAKTSDQLHKILYKYGEKAAMKAEEIDRLFVGEGFDRLVLASGGVPRDFLSLLLEALASKPDGEEHIGKDDVRILSRTVLQKRIEELKADSEEQDQDGLLRGIYAIVKFVLDKKTNIFMVDDRVLQEQSDVRDLLNRLLDYRIIHLVGGAFTHKSAQGTYTAYMINIGAYANLRKLEGRFTEIDITAKDAKERIRNASILDHQTLLQLYQAAPAQPEAELVQSAEAADEGG